MSIHPSSRIYSEEYDKWAGLLIVSGVATLFISAGFALGWVGVFIATGLTFLLAGVTTMSEQGIKWKLGVHSTYCERRFDELVLDQALKQRPPHEVRVSMIDNHPDTLIVARCEINVVRARTAFDAIGLIADYAAIQSPFGGKRWRTIIVLPPDFTSKEAQSQCVLETYADFVGDLQLKLVPDGKLYQL